jgi:hypothetical protein
LLLHLVYESHQAGRPIDWTKAAKRLDPQATGNAVNQHLNKLRSGMLKAGHLVPPSRSSEHPGGPSIRGYIINHDAGPDDPDVRAVSWDEEVEEKMNPFGIKAFNDGVATHRKTRVKSGPAKSHPAFSKGKVLKKEKNPHHPYSGPTGSRARADSTPVEDAVMDGDSEDEYVPPASESTKRKPGPKKSIVPPSKRTKTRAATALSASSRRTSIETRVDKDSTEVLP